jgi:hypothetical protein
MTGFLTFTILEVDQKKKIVTHTYIIAPPVATDSQMAATLTVSSKLSPFPFAALAIASYNQNAEIVFDESSTEVVLELNGSKITAESDIVHALAKGAQDNTVVRGSLTHLCDIY